MTSRPSRLQSECRVLVVEDDPASASDLRAILARAGVETVVIVSSAEAAGAVADVRPSVVVMAVALDAGADGIEIAARAQDARDRRSAQGARGRECSGLR